MVVIQLHEASLELLVKRCSEETAHFFRRVMSDTRYCWELFRRAIVERQEAAWTAVYAQYQGIVRSWLTRHPQLAPTGETAEDLVNSVFTKMWGALNPEKFAHFDSLSALLGYLKTCVHSTVVDCLRRSRRDEIYLKEITHPVDASEAGAEGYHASQPSPEDEVFYAISAQELWGRILAHLHDDQEELVVYASYVLDETPREIYAHYPDRFGSIQEIYDIKRNVVNRLKRRFQAAK